MTLQQRLVALAQAVGGDVKTLLARSLPPGGTVGQVLTKTGAADYASGWATPKPERVPFSFNADGAGYYRYNAACTLALESAAVGTGALAYATSPDGATWTTVTLPTSPSAAGVLRVALTGCTTFNAVTLVRS